MSADVATTEDTDREAANRLDYERFLLSSVIYGDAARRMIDVLQVIPEENASYFSNRDNRCVYRVLCGLSKSDDLPSDALLITNEIWDTISSHPDDYKCSFRSARDVQRYVYSLNVTSMPGIRLDAYREYAERVKWTHDRQAYEAFGLELANRAKSVPFAEREEFVTGMEARVSNLSLEVRGSDGLRPLPETTPSTRDRLAIMRDWRPIDMGLSIGLPSVDAYLNGLNRGELIILAAPTGCGKSMLANHIAIDVATREDPRSVLLFSLEMMDDQLTDRAIANLARVNVDMYKKQYRMLLAGDYSRYGADAEREMRARLESQNERLRRALDYYETLPIYTDVTPSLNANEMKSLVLQKKNEIEAAGRPPVGLIIVDYLQIMAPVDTKSNSSRADIVGDMSRRLKRIAKETGVPILCLAQLNRQAQLGERPTLSMLRESGSIEQDADKVMFLWSEDAGKQPADYADVPPTPDADAIRRLACTRDKMRMRITIAKNRQGQTGDCDVIGDYAFQHFASQSASHIGSEPFDDFFRSYYRKTRSGEDLYWPSGVTPPGLAAYRRLERPEMLWVGGDYSLHGKLDAVARWDERHAFRPEGVSVRTEYGGGGLLGNAGGAPSGDACPATPAADAAPMGAPAGLSRPAGDGVRGRDGRNDGVTAFRPVVVEDDSGGYGPDDEEAIDLDELDDFGMGPEDGM